MLKNLSRNICFGMLFCIALTTLSEAATVSTFEPLLIVVRSAPTSNDRIRVTASYWAERQLWFPVVKSNANRITVELSSGVDFLLPPPAVLYSTIWLDPLPEGNYQLDVVLKDFLYYPAAGVRRDYSYPSRPITVGPATNIEVADAVEYYNTLLQHYFITASMDEMGSIEHFRAGPGWQPTGSGFRGFLSPTAAPAGVLPVCRFYGTPGLGPNSHFYTVDATECAMVKQDPGWTYEGIAFYLFAPLNGQCATGQQAVYRVYNNRYAQNDANHRYMSDPSLYAQMQAQGWLPEGVAFCGPLTL